MSASATAVLWAGEATGSTVPARMTDAERRAAGEARAAERRLREATPKVLADPQPHTRALQARGNARRAALTGAGASDPIRRTPPPIPPPQLQTCSCGKHTVEVGIANALARRKHAAQLAKLEAARASAPAGPRSR